MINWTAIIITVAIVLGACFIAWCNTRAGVEDDD